MLHVDKSRANRLLEPFMWHTAIISGTDWDNFLALRDHPAAQPEFQRVAAAMREGLNVNHPRALMPGEWHLPLVDDDEIYRSDLLRENEFDPGIPLGPMVSAGRCARVSYDRQHDAEAPAKSARRWLDLTRSGHWSPGEHPAMCRDEVAYHGNFRGFKQLRKFYPHEEDFSCVSS
jgi:thymidylate synthase ThyX